MNINPISSWKWHYNGKRKALTLELDSQWIFISPYCEKKLIPDIKKDTLFSEEHINYYNQIYLSLAKQLNYSSVKLTQIALNMTALKFFSLPIMPQSWHFKKQNHTIALEAGDVIHLENQEGELILSTIIEAKNYLLLLIIDEETKKISGSRTLTQFNFIKVAHDRIKPMNISCINQYKVI